MYEYKDYILTKPNEIVNLTLVDPYIVFSNEVGMIQVRSLDSLEQLEWRPRHPEIPFSSITGFDKYLYIGNNNGIIEIYNLEEWQLESEYLSQIEKPYPIIVTTDYIIIVGRSKIEVLDRDSKQFLGFLTPPSQFPDSFFGTVSVSKNKLAADLSSEAIGFWDIQTFKEESIFSKEEWISSFLLKDNLLLIASDECMEFDNDCSIHIWDLKNLKIIKKLGGGLQKDYYFNLKIRKPFQSSNPLLLALAAGRLDFWEWGSWKHITQIIELPWAQSCELIGEYLFLSDITGKIQIWKHSE